LKDRVLWKRSDVLAYLRCGRTKLWEMEANDLFPTPIRLLSAGGLPGRTCYWDRAEVERWLEARVFARKHTTLFTVEQIRLAHAGLHGAFCSLKSDVEPCIAANRNSEFPTLVSEAEVNQ
jgi:predicted DNA-binding transcriptional regulator AlpA